MAVFLINICKFNGCGITFPSLADLIQHIEDTHIDYDPKTVEQKEQAQPTCLPLSYVLRFITDAARKENQFIAAATTGLDLKKKLSSIKHHTYSISSSVRSNTPTGSEQDEDEMIVSESEDSNESWTTEEFSSEFIMRYGSRHSVRSSANPTSNEKPFACPVPGCKKRYKNVNGIKYHSKNGHKKDGKVRKGYKCHCGKSYKTAQGLKSHAMTSHNNVAAVLATSSDSSGTAVTTTMAIGSLASRCLSPSQSAGSVSPSSMSSLSGSSGTSSISSVPIGLITQNFVHQLPQTSISLPVTIQQKNSFLQASNTSNQIRSGNFTGGISIVTTSTKSNFVASGSGGPTAKILKFITEQTHQSKMIPDPSLGNKTSSNGYSKQQQITAMPGVVNLGVFSSLQCQSHQDKGLSTNGQAAVFQQPQKTINTVNHEMLPLTPISPINSDAACLDVNSPGCSESTAVITSEKFHEKIKAPTSET